jgi:hypothetical protein
MNDFYKKYSDFLNKKHPVNIKGDFLKSKDYLKEEYISPKNKKYNSRGNVINEMVNEVLIPGLPVNTKIKFNEQLMVKSIQYGLVLLINYSGDKDNWKGGRERIIYPMVIGINRHTRNMLVRGWHLTGWSVSKRKNVKKEWRLFKTDNIKSMLFTGDFYRLPPKGYKMNDRIMTERIIKSSDFGEIRRRQDSLIRSGKLEYSEKQEIGDEKKSTITKIDCRYTDTTLNIKTPFDNKYISDYKKNIENLKLTFLKNISKDEIVVIIGAIGTKNRTTKLYDNKQFIGNYKVVDSVKGDKIKRLNNIKGKIEFPLYTFSSVL